MELRRISNLMFVNADLMKRWEEMQKLNPGTMHEPGTMLCLALEDGMRWQLNKVEEQIRKDLHKQAE